MRGHKLVYYSQLDAELDTDGVEDDHLRSIKKADYIELLKTHSEFTDKDIAIMSDYFWGQRRSYNVPRKMQTVLGCGNTDDAY
eukprot:TRINITY_DN3580_c0_g1_i1.p2 TRINITY_DN3580_c0_g1~~TRINITY_DN3580_c0_g1_i1.p2  ORF type:complete len:83 (+),score=16.30 TRINITY_DN3580_c0_g1_i1:137-385(+)